MSLLKATLSFCKPQNVVVWRTFTLARRCSSQFPISRYPVPERSTLPKDIQERIDKVEEKSGFLPNVFQALAYRSDEFRAFFNYYDVIMEKEGGLSKAEKELIIVATSSVNNCTYCIIAHGALHRIFSKRPLVADQVAINWECADITSRERAILNFAMRITKAEPVSDVDFQKLESEGLTKEDAWDIAAIAAFFAMSNRMAHLTNMRPNDEFYTLGRQKREKKD